VELPEAPQVPHEWIDGPERVRSRCMDENDRNRVRPEGRRGRALKERKEEPRRKETRLIRLKCAHAADRDKDRERKSTGASTLFRHQYGLSCKTVIVLNQPGQRRGTGTVAYSSGVSNSDECACSIRMNEK
jgi:hypothetical protein